MSLLTVEIVVRDDSGHTIHPPWLLVDGRIVKGSPTDNGWEYDIEIPVVLEGKK